VALSTLLAGFQSCQSGQSPKRTKKPTVTINRNKPKLQEKSKQNKTETTEQDDWSKSHSEKV